MHKAEPTKEHQWLHQLVGDWAYEHEAAMGPDQPKQKVTGTERVRPVGGLWVVAEGQGEMPGGGVAQTVLTLGYDPQKQRFVGTWSRAVSTRGARSSRSRPRGPTSSPRGRRRRTARRSSS